MPSRFFWIALGYLVVLMGVFVLYQVSPSLFDDVPDNFGPLPFEVPWFGAMGGALISLTGIFKHNRDWDPKYDYWHYARPLVGAAIGSVGTLLFYVVVQAADTDKSVDLNVLVFDSIAFLIGYREESFRELIRRMTDLFLKPAAEETKPQ
jgi:hypothetical protein